jgi:hypothetical protein
MVWITLQFNSHPGPFRAHLPDEEVCVKVSAANCCGRALSGSPRPSWGTVCASAVAREGCSPMRGRVERCEADGDRDHAAYLGPAGDGCSRSERRSADHVGGGRSPFDAHPEWRSGAAGSPVCRLVRPARAGLGHLPVTDTSHSHDGRALDRRWRTHGEGILGARRAHGEPPRAAACRSLVSHVQRQCAAALETAHRGVGLLRYAAVHPARRWGCSGPRCRLPPVHGLSDVARERPAAQIAERNTRDGRPSRTRPPVCRR